MHCSPNLERLKDLTNQLDEAEGKLIKSQRLLHEIFESSHDAMVVVDSDGLIVLFNRKASSMFGYAKDRIVGKPIETLMPGHFKDTHESHRNLYITNPSQRPMGACKGLYGQRENGETFNLDIMLSPVKTNGDLLVLARVKEITGVENE